MCSIKVRLAKHRITSQGHPIVFQLIHERKKRIIATPYWAYPEAFDETYQKVVENAKFNISVYKSKKINKYLRDEEAILRNIITRLEEKGRYSVTDIVERYQIFQNGYTLDYLFGILMDELKEQQKMASFYIHKAVLAQIKDVFGQSSIHILEINDRWINTFVEKLRKQALRENTVRLYLRVLKAAYNKALKKGIIKVDVFPFANTSTGVTKTDKRALNKTVIKRIIRLNTEGNPSLTLGKDLFLFSLYTRGMPFVDMAYLRKSNIMNQTIYYKRKKSNCVYG